MRPGQRYRKKQGKEKLEKMISLGPKINFRNW